MVPSRKLLCSYTVGRGPVLQLSHIKYLNECAWFHSTTGNILVDCQMYVADIIFTVLGLL